MLKMAAYDEGYDQGEDMEIAILDGSIEMDIDLSEEELLIGELHSYRSSNVLSPTQHEKNFYGIPVETQQVDYSDFLYIVLDTNVLLSHLKFLKELKDHSIKGVGRPVLIIPWIVIQELDALKSSSGTLGSQAVRAGTFINESLSAHHPRIRGQTMEEVNTELNNVAIENNDDRILHCVMVYQSKTKGVVVLFSNDTMLCAKAKINNVIACNRKTLMKELKRIVSSSNKDTSYAQTREYSQKVNEEIDKHNNSRMFDDILCEAESHARESLSVIINHEMTTVYGELSNDILARKPPWSLDDVLYLLNKHWIAVFNFTFGRSNFKTKKLLQELQEHQETRQSVYLTSETVASFINTVLGIIEQFNNNRALASLLNVHVASLKVLCKKLQEKPRPPPPKPHLPTTTNPTIGLPTLSPLPSPSSLHSATPALTGSPLDHLTFIFGSVRESIISTIMNIQGSLLNQSFNEEAEMKLMTVLRCLEELIMSIENLLNQGMLLPLVKLIYQSLVNYINNVLLIINIQLTEAQLIDLCQVQVTSVVSIFRQSLDFMIGGRYQLLQLYHQAAAANLS